MKVAEDELGSGLRMISQAYNVFDSISTNKFIKHFICEVASSITDDSYGCPKFAQNIPF